MCIVQFIIKYVYLNMLETKCRVFIIICVDNKLVPCTFLCDYFCKSEVRASHSYCKVVYHELAFSSEFRLLHVLSALWINSLNL